MIENLENGFIKFGTDSGSLALCQILACNVTHNYYMLGATTKLSSSRVADTFKRSTCDSNLNIKKYRNKKIKTLEVKI